MPCGLCAAVPLVKPAKEPEGCPVQCNNNMECRKLVRPSELPIYVPDDACRKKMSCTEQDHTPSLLEENIGHVRRSVQGVMSEYGNARDKVAQVVETGWEHSQFIVEYLQEESNTLPRIGAVGISGLTGLVLGLRGGTMKRLIYTSTGALTAGVLIYPRQAQEGFELMKHYANIAYNFVYGVTPEDGKQGALELPKLPDIQMPTNLSEYFTLVLDLGKSAVSSVQHLVESISANGAEKSELRLTIKLLFTPVYSGLSEDKLKESARMTFYHEDEKLTNRTEVPTEPEVDSRKHEKSRWFGWK